MEDNSSQCQFSTLTIAGNGEGCNVSSMMTDEDPDQCNIEDHALHQHPHEGD